MKRNNLLKLLIICLFLVIVSGCYKQTSIDVTVEIPQFEDISLNFVLVAIQQDGTRVEKIMKKTGSILSGKISGIKPGIWSLALDLDVRQRVIASIPLAANINIDKTRKKLHFGYQPSLERDPSLIGEINIKQFYSVGEEVSLLPILANVGQIETNLVYFPEGSNAQLEKKESSVTLVLDKEGLFIVEIVATTDTHYDQRYIYLNCVTSTELNIAVEEIVAFRDTTLLYTQEKILIIYKDNGNTQITLEEIDSFQIDKARDIVALLTGSEIVIWDIESESKIELIEPQFEVEKILYFNEDVILVLTPSGVLYSSNGQNWLPTSFHQPNLFLLEGTNIFIVNVGTGYLSVYYYNEFTEKFVFLDNFGYVQEVTQDVWGLSGGRFILDNGVIGRINSRNTGTFSTKKIIADSEKITFLSTQDRSLLYVVSSKDSSCLVLMDEESLVLKKKWDLPFIKNESGIVHPNVLACLIKDEIVQVFVKYSSEAIKILEYSL